MTKSEAIRNAFTALGMKATAPEVQAWVRSKYPEFRLPGNYVSKQVIHTVRFQLKKNPPIPAPVPMPSAAKETEPPVEETSVGLASGVVPPAAEEVMDKFKTAPQPPAKTVGVEFTRAEAWALVRAVEFHNSGGLSTPNKSDEAAAGWAAKRLVLKLLNLDPA